METKREYQKIRRHSPITAESVGEHTLPDYNPDVRKLVHTAARIIPGARFTDGERTELPVTVFYDVIYLDSDGGLNHTDFTSDAELATSLGEGVDESIFTPELLGFNVRLTGPRRFSARANLGARLRTRERKAFDIDGDTFTSTEPEIAEEKIQIMCESWGESRENEAREDVWEREGAILDEVKILLCEAMGRVEPVRMADGCAEVKGEIKIGMLISVADECAEYVEKILPVAESVSVDADGACQAEIAVKDVTPTLRAGEDGVCAEVSLKYTCRVSCCYNAGLSVIKDCYSRERESVNEYTELRYEELVCAMTHTVKISEEIPREGILTSDTRNVVYSSGTPRIEEISASGSEIKIRGKVRVSGVACEAFADGSLSYSGMKLDLPYEANVNVDRHLPDGVTVEGRAYASSSSVAIDGDKMYVSLDLVHCLTVYKERGVNCVGASVLSGDVVERDPSLITVYYPSAGESLFEIAKKHHASVLTIASDNALSDTCLASPSAEGSLSGVKKLIIR